METEKNQLSFYKRVLHHCIRHFKGRAQRSEFWRFTLFSVCVIFAIGVALNFLNEKEIISKQLSNGIWVIVFLLVSYFQLAVTFRRLHDIGKTGWWAGSLALLGVSSILIGEFIDTSISSWIVLLFIILNLIIIVGYCTIDSQKESNKYGLSPKYDISYDTKQHLNYKGLLDSCGGCLTMLFAIGVSIIGYISIYWLLHRFFRFFV